MSVPVLPPSACCMCAAPGQLMLRDECFGRAWYCDYECFHRRCHALHDARRVLSTALPTGRVVRENELQQAVQGRLNTPNGAGADAAAKAAIDVTKDLIDKLIEPAPNASDDDRKLEIKQRKDLFNALQHVVDLVPSEADLGEHRKVLFKLLDVIAKRYDAPGEAAVRDSLLLVWQLLVSTVRTLGINVPDDLAPPAPGSAGVKRARVQPEVPPMQAPPPMPSVGVGPVVAYAPGGGGAADRLKPHSDALVKEAARSAKSTGATLASAAVYRLAAAMMKPAGEDTLDAAKAIGAMIRNTVLTNDRRNLVDLANLRNGWLAPNEQQIAFINAQNPLTSAFYNSIVVSYYALAQRVIESFVSKIAANDAAKIATMLNEKDYKKEGTATYFAAAVGRGVPIDARDAPGRYADLNWVHRVAEEVRRLRVVAGSYIVAANSPEIEAVIVDAAVKNPMRW